MSIDANTAGKSHRNAPETSRESAYAVMPATGSIRRRILNAIARATFTLELGLTDEEGQDRLGIHSNTYRARRIELVEGGWIEDSGRRRKTRARNNAVVWKLSEKGLEHR